MTYVVTLNAFIFLKKESTVFAAAGYLPDMLFSPDPYKKLRAHLNKQPVGFPRSFNGAELRLLKKIFTPEDACIARGLDYRFKSADMIAQELKRLKIEVDESILFDKLRSMASRGSLLFRQTDSTFALLPFIVGMFEMQLNHLTREFSKDTRSYAIQSYALEYLSTGVPQTRVIPIHESIEARHHIATYEYLDKIIAAAGSRIAIVKCICRESEAKKGRHCRYTDRIELCMVFNDFADTVIRESWGRAISQTEALAIAEKNQEEGLVLQSSNEQNPQFLCACCSDCCGLLAMITAVPRPADYVGGGFTAKIDLQACIGCGICIKRCHTKAIAIDKGKAYITDGKCIGCGLCVAKCPKKAIELEAREYASVPPVDTEQLFEQLKAHRPGLIKKISIGVRAVLGLKNHKGKHAAHGTRKDN
jgi:Na+-translocating ferredoxin:NAD+ oxidoreductase subunit B